MALLKELEVRDTGVMANYIRVLNVSFLPDETSQVVVQCGLYKDKASRDAGKEPILNLTFNTSSQEMINSLVDICYTELKKQPELADAIDI